MIYYKVVSDYMWSARGYLSPNAVQYRVGKFVNPKLENSKLFVFGSLSAARSFANSDERIFSCEVENPSKAKLCCKYTHAVNEFWKRKSARKSVKNISFVAPENTYFCDAVKLAREII